MSHICLIFCGACGLNHSVNIHQMNLMLAASKEISGKMANKSVRVLEKEQTDDLDVAPELENSKLDDKFENQMNNALNVERMSQRPFGILSSRKPQFLRPLITCFNHQSEPVTHMSTESKNFFCDICVAENRHIRFGMSRCCEKDLVENATELLHQLSDMRSALDMSVKHFEAIVRGQTSVDGQRLKKLYATASRLLTGWVRDERTFKQVTKYTLDEKFLNAGLVDLQKERPPAPWEKDIDKLMNLKKVMDSVIMP